MYFSRNDDGFAFENFAKRIDQIEENQRKLHDREVTYSQGLNEFSDSSVESFNDNVNGFISLVPTAKLLNVVDFLNVVLPLSLNYTALGYVTSVRNQVNFKPNSR